MVTQYKNSYTVAVVGATGNAGSQTLNVMAEYDFPASKVYAIASSKSKDKKVHFGRNGDLKVHTIDEVDPRDIDIVFFCAGSQISSEYVCKFADAGAVVIDKTSHFRFHPQVPLVVPEINAHVLEKGLPLGVVSNPNCVAIPLTLTLDALQKKSLIKRVIVSTYQAVSGAGKAGTEELYYQTVKSLNAEDIVPTHFRKRIAFNVIPAIGPFKASGATDEEEKISAETLKILGKNVKVFSTCVRVPVFLGHSISVVAELEDDMSPYEAAKLFGDYKGIVVMDNPEENTFITPIEAQGQDVVFVSRIRRDHTAPNTIAYWICCDNLRKGAALNGVQIAKFMAKLDPSLERFRKPR